MSSALIRVFLACFVLLAAFFTSGAHALPAARGAVMLSHMRRNDWDAAVPVATLAKILEQPQPAQPRASLPVNVRAGRRSAGWKNRLDAVAAERSVYDA